MCEWSAQNQGVSNRLLKGIDELIRALATFESRYDLESVNRTQDSIDELLEIMAVVHSTRYFNSRRQLIKHIGALQILSYSDLF